jgi:ethanolamine utilization protein EutQ (cupin superfamily)
MARDFGRSTGHVPTSYTPTAPKDAPPRGWERKEPPMTTALHTMQKKSLNSPDEAHVYGRIKKENVALHGVEVHRVTFDREARWSIDLKPVAQTASCMLPHVAYVQSGRLHVVMDDGSEDEFGAGDIMLLPPGHDAWTVGDEPCVFIEFSAGTNYYTGG